MEVQQRLTAKRFFEFDNARLQRLHLVAQFRYQCLLRGDLLARLFVVEQTRRKLGLQPIRSNNKKARNRTITRPDSGYRRGGFLPRKPHRDLCSRLFLAQTDGLDLGFLRARQRHCIAYRIGPALSQCKVVFPAAALIGVTLQKTLAFRLLRRYWA